MVAEIARARFLIVWWKRTHASLSFTNRMADMGGRFGLVSIWRGGTIFFWLTAIVRFRFRRFFLCGKQPAAAMALSASVRFVMIHELGSFLQQLFAKQFGFCSG